MQTLQISDHAAQQLHDLAAREHLTETQLIERLIQRYREQPTKLTDFAGVLAHSSVFNGDPLAIQQAMRDEWD